MAAGRPTDYSKELADEFCSRLVDGTSVRTVCLADDMPCQTTIFKWLSKYEEFVKQYEKAKEMAAEAIAEEMFDIADDGFNDWMEVRGKDGDISGYKINGEAVSRSKLRVDTRKWYLSQIKPKKYGEKKQIDLTMDDSLADRIMRARSRDSET